MRVRTLFIAVLLVFAFSASALAVTVEEEKKPAVGAFGLYSFVPDGFLDMGFDKHASISAAAYGVWASYGFGAYDLHWRVSNWTLMMDDTYWLSRTDDEDEQFYVESNLGVVGLDMSMLWKWRVHEAVEPYVGPTLGLGFVYGDLDVTDTNDNGRKVGDSQEKQVPPVFPLVGFAGGCRFYPDPRVRLSVDLGFLNGLFVGISAGYAF